MASPRITKVMREGIVENTLTAQFGKAKEALVKREQALANRAYHQQYKPVTIKAMEDLGDRFIEYSGTIRLNVGGRALDLTLDKSRPCHKGANWSSSRFVPDAKLTADIEKYLDDAGDHNKLATQARVQLTAVLESVQSFKKLRAVWPQGVKFYDMYDVDTETKSSVPAVVVTELNKALGIK